MQAFSKRNDLILPYLNNFVLVVVKVAESNSSPPDNVNSTAFALVGDLLETFGVNMLPFVDLPHYETLLQRCRSSKNGKSKTVVNYVLRSASHVKRQAGQA